MRRIVLFVTAVSLAVGLIGGFASAAGAQTGDLAAFCAGRLEANDAQGKAANLAVIEKVFAAAPAAAVPAITQIRDGYKKKGDKFFDSPAGGQALTALDSYVYANCPGKQVPVTAIDYQYTGMPSSLPAGPATFKLTNAAPKEDHMLAIQKLTPAAQGQDLVKLLSLPGKQQGKYFEEKGGSFAFAPAGQVAYAPIALEPGTYAYACFLPQGGKKNGKPHFMLGMNGTFTVS